MRSRRVIVLLALTGLGLSQVSCGASKQEPVADEMKEFVAGEMQQEELKVEEVWRPIGYIYHHLVTGGSIYVGTVLSVTVKRSNPGEIFCPPGEDGTFRFRVNKTVIGPSHKELTLGYWWMDDSKYMGASSDWVCNSGPWKKRPRPADRLMLLLTGNKRDAEQMNGKDGGPVWRVWRDADPNHPLVKDLEEVGKYMAEKDEKKRDELFTKICQSEWVRGFAFDNAFFWMSPEDRTVYGENYNSSRQSHLALQYLKYAAPKITDETEKSYLSLGLSMWLVDTRDKYDELPDDLAAHIEDWYLAELAAVDSVPRCNRALEGLKRWFKLLGIPRTLKIFKKRGLIVLEARLNACERSKEASIQKNSKELLHMLRVYHENRSGKKN